MRKTGVLLLALLMLIIGILIGYSISTLNKVGTMEEAVITQKSITYYTSPLFSSAGSFTTTKLGEPLYVEILGWRKISDPIETYEKVDTVQPYVLLLLKSNLNLEIECHYIDWLKTGEEIFTRSPYSFEILERRGDLYVINIGLHNDKVVPSAANYYYEFPFSFENVTKLRVCFRARNLPDIEYYTENLRVKNGKVCVYFNPPKAFVEIIDVQFLGIKREGVDFYYIFNVTLRNIGDAVLYGKWTFENGHRSRLLMSLPLKAIAGKNLLLKLSRNSWLSGHLPHEYWMEPEHEYKFSYILPGEVFWVMGKFHVSDGIRTYNLALEEATFASTLNNKTVKLLNVRPEVNVISYKIKRSIISRWEKPRYLVKMTLRVTNNSTRPLILAPITPETSFMRIIVYNNTHQYMSDSSLFFTYPDGMVIASHFEVVNGDQIS